MQSNKAGSLYLIVLSVFLIGIGSLFTYLLGKSYLQAKAMEAWIKVPAIILQSEIQERKIGQDVESDYRHQFLYGYYWKGQSLTSDHFDIRGANWSKNRSVIAKRVQDYPIGKQVIAHVNEKNGEMAVIQLDSKAPGYSIWFPLLFVVGGLGLLFNSLTKFL